MRILVLDLELSPNLAHVWSLWNQNVGLPQLRESSELLCFAARWYGEDNVMFFSKWGDGKGKMVRAAYRLVDDADAVMHYNGTRFDMPHLNREFLVAGLGPPAPYQEIDLLKAVRKKFNFPSNKLDYVARVLGLEGKVAHEGHELWVKVMAGDEGARQRMREYNVRDVDLLVDLYEKLLPWLPGHPNRAIGSGVASSCVRCGSSRLTERDSCSAGLSEYQCWQCLGCGGFMRATRRRAGAAMKAM